MKKVAPTRIKDLLGGAIRRAGIEREVTVAQILETANATVATLLPPGHAADARAISLREGILTVACLHASAASTVSRGANAVLDAVKRAAPKADIRRVFARIEGALTRPSGVIE